MSCCLSRRECVELLYENKEPKESLPDEIVSSDYEKCGNPIGLVIRRTHNCQCKVLRIRGFNREKMTIWLDDGKTARLSKFNGYKILNRVQV
jgi:hypothetical protein